MSAQQILTEGSASRPLTGGNLTLGLSMATVPTAFSFGANARCPAVYEQRASPVWAGSVNRLGARETGERDGTFQIVCRDSDPDAENAVLISDAIFVADAAHTLEDRKLVGLWEQREVVVLGVYWVSTIEAKREDHRAAQRARVRGAARVLAGLAAFRSHGLSQVPRRKARTSMSTSRCGRGCHVRVVAIGANHEAFVDAVFEGHGKLRAHVVVAAVAEIDLALGEQKLRYWRFVDQTMWLKVCWDGRTSARLKVSA